MSISIHRTESLPEESLYRVAHFVSSFTKSHDGLEAKLLQLTPDNVAARRGLIGCNKHIFRGYVGIHSPTEDAKVQLGPFIVPGAYRRRGIGTALLAAAALSVYEEGHTPYVMGNSNNMGNLIRTGFETLPEDQIPPETDQLCKTKCPLFINGEPCCNTAMLLRGEPLIPAQSIDPWPTGKVIEILR